MDDKKFDLKKKNFYAKICFGEALFPPLVKAKNELQNSKTWNKKDVENFCYLEKKFWWWKRKKLFKIYNFHKKSNYYLLFTVFGSRAVDG